MSESDRDPRVSALVARLAGRCSVDASQLETIISHVFTDPHDDVWCDEHRYHIGHGPTEQVPKDSVEGRVLDELLGSEGRAYGISSLSERIGEDVSDALGSLGEALDASVAYDLVSWGEQEPSVSLVRRCRHARTSPLATVSLVGGDLPPRLELAEESGEREVIDRLYAGETLVSDDVRDAFGVSDWRPRFDALVSAHNALVPETYISTVPNADRWAVTLRSGAFNVRDLFDPPTAYYRDVALCDGSLWVGDDYEYRDVFRRAPLVWMVSQLFVNNPESPLYLSEVKRLTNEGDTTAGGQSPAYATIRRFARTVDEHAAGARIERVSGTVAGDPAYVLTAR